VSSLTQRYESENHTDELWSNDDELGRLVRGSLSTSIGNAQPSPEVWHTILERVQEQRSPGPAQRTLRCSSAPVTALVQATIIGCVLMTLGLGMRQDVIVARSSLAVDVPSSTEAALVSEPMPTGSSDGGLLVRVEQEQPFRAGGRIREATLPS
jgi:hypothetical protein